MFKKTVLHQKTEPKDQLLEELKKEYHKKKFNYFKDK